MRLLAIDVGGGTQDILLLDTTTSIENSVKMVMPSPTRVVARKIAEAAQRKQKLLFSGVTMGGGPSRHALEKYLQHDLQAFATPQAACTFDDDLDEVRRLGVKLVSVEEAGKLTGVNCIEMRDIDLEAIRRTLDLFGAPSSWDGLAVAALDHGAAPEGFSDRVFRFQHLQRKVQERNELVSFAYLREELPPYLTRMQAIAGSVDSAVPLLIMDTGPAAALGSFLDEEVMRHPDVVVANVGNFHTLAFHLHGEKALGLFEHHTGLLNAAKMDDLIQRLAAGKIREGEVFEDGGHGSFILEGDDGPFFLAICGPQRHMMRESRLHPYFVAPYGDMMLTGCFGLASAFARRMPQWRDEIEGALSPFGKGGYRGI
ncbi:MAG: pyruvate formate lyase-activating protein [Chloroflexi bacterium]|nr:pyruvate formate lyase-activating protein [Chloroflexota bacterium]